MKFNQFLSRLMTVLLAVFLVGAFTFEAEA